MKFLSAQDKQGLTLSKHCFWKNLMGHDSKEENYNEPSLTFVQFCWVMAHFWNFEKYGLTQSYVLFITTPLSLEKLISFKSIYHNAFCKMNRLKKTSKHQELK